MRKVKLRYKEAVRGRKGWKECGGGGSVRGKGSCQKMKKYKLGRTGIVGAMTDRSGLAKKAWEVVGIKSTVNIINEKMVYSRRLS